MAPLHFFKAASLLSESLFCHFGTHSLDFHGIYFPLVPVISDEFWWNFTYKSWKNNDVILINGELKRQQAHLWSVWKNLVKSIRSKSSQNLNPLSLVIKLKILWKSWLNSFSWIRDSSVVSAAWQLTAKLGLFTSSRNDWG